MEAIKNFIYSNAATGLFVALLIISGLYWAESNDNEALQKANTELDAKAKQMNADLERLRLDMESRRIANELIDSRLKQIESSIGKNQDKLRKDIQNLIAGNGTPGDEIHVVWDSYLALTTPREGEKNNE